MIDTWQSRRNNFIECKYWSQINDENLVSLSEIAYKRQPTATFMAKENGSYAQENQIVDNSFMYDKNSVELETTDDVRDLKTNDLVEFRDEIYRVTNVQRTKSLKQAQFLKEPISIKTFISLMR